MEGRLCGDGVADGLKFGAGEDLGIHEICDDECVGRF